MSFIPEIHVIFLKCTFSKQLTFVMHAPKLSRYRVSFT